MQRIQPQMGIKKAKTNLAVSKAPKSNDILLLNNEKDDTVIVEE